ncbi:MAG: aspartate/glutamate racemase family protein [Rhodoferax sp.]|nr:aspartate/glutamate racemase family protein [Rhodoferax sp.]
MAQLLLINPNTNAATTRAMVAVARGAAGDQAQITGLTAVTGTDLICDEPALAAAADAVLALRPRIEARRIHGVIIAAFGDPGRALLAQGLPCPVTGIAEAGLAEAASGGRRFAVVTTTPGLVGAITRTVHQYGLSDTFCGGRLTGGDPRATTSNAGRLLDALFAACLAAVQLDGADAIVIGGGPLAVAARALEGRLPVPIIEPVPAAVRLALRRANPGASPGG